MAHDVEIQKLGLYVGSAFKTLSRDLLELLALRVDFVLQLTGIVELLLGKFLDFRHVLVDELQKLPRKLEIRNQTLQILRPERHVLLDSLPDLHRD